MRILNVSDCYSLESNLNNLALEANFITNLIEHFREVMPSLAAKLQDVSNSFAHSSLFDKGKAKELRVAYDQTKAVIYHQDFINVADTLVSIPEGFQGNLQDYLKLLIQLNTIVYKEANSFLSDYNFILSDFITNKEAKKSALGHQNLVKQMTLARQNHLKAIAHYFDNTDRSKIKLKSIIGRFADLKDLVDQAIQLEQAQNPNNLQGIADAVAKTVSLLNIIKQHLEEDKLIDISGPMADSISHGAYQLAQYIEFVSIFKFKCNQAVQSVSNILERLK